MFSRRETLIGSLLGLLGLSWRQAAAQQSAWSGLSLNGRTALVTGSTSGLGREVARRLGAMGANVIVHGRDRERGNTVAEAIRREGGEAVFYRADLASLAEVRELAEMVKADHERLDILVNNAGIGTGALRERRTSEDGYELGFAVNYLSHFLLTRELLPLIRESAPARIVNVSSLGQSPVDFDDIMLEDAYSAGRSYTQSKLAQVLFTISLAERLDPERVTVNSLHPATFMDTPLVREAGRDPRSTVDEGATAVMQLAVSPDLVGETGQFYNGLDESRANAQAYDAAARERLWNVSVELTERGA